MFKVEITQNPSGGMYRWEVYEQGRVFPFGSGKTYTLRGAKKAAKKAIKNYKLKKSPNFVASYTVE